MCRKLNRITAFLLLLVFLAVDLMIPDVYRSVTANALHVIPEPQWSATVNAGEYNLRVWLSDSEYGDSPAYFHKGLLYYLCYELSYADTGALVTETDMVYTVASAIYRQDGSTAYSVVQDNYYRGWISNVADSLGTYTGVVTLSGDLSGSVSVTWTVTVPYVNLRAWVSDSEWGDVPKHFIYGQRYYLCYELTDLNRNEPLNASVKGYQATVTIYDPDGTVAHTADYDDMHHAWISLLNGAVGTWTGKVTLTGDIDLETTISWNVTRPLAGSDRFIWGTDNWRFNNHSKYFTSGYVIDEDILAKMSDDLELSNIERELLKETDRYRRYTNFNGACFGMTMSEILVKQGMLDLTRYGGKKVVSENTCTPEMQSVSNLLWELQLLPGMGQYVRYYGYKTDTQADILARLADTVKNEAFLVNLCYDITSRSNDSNEPVYSGHSVLVYGLEECSYTSPVTQKSYDMRLLIADPNALAVNDLYEDACLYFDSKDYSWIVPYMNKDGDTCYWNATSGKSTPYGRLKTIMRHTSLTEAENLMLDGTAEYIGRIDVYSNSNIKPSFGKAPAGTDTNHFAGQDCIEEQDINAEASIESQHVNWTFWTSADRKLSYKVPTTFRFTMDCEKAGYIASVTNAVTAVTKYDGYVKLSGKAMAYDVSIITNAAQCVTDWYTVEVSGSNADSVTYYLTEDGYVLESDHLQDITVNAHNSSKAARVTFSADYDAVLIYEIDPTTIGVAVDTDGDGSFETDIISTGALAPVLGDVNGDTLIDASDAALILVEAALTGAGNPGEFTAKQTIAADVNKDGIVDASDAAVILVYAAKVGSGHTDAKIEDFA